MRKLNQYQANHNPGSKSAGPDEISSLIGVIVLVSILVFSLFVFSWITG